MGGCPLDHERVYRLEYEERTCGPISWRRRVPSTRRDLSSRSTRESHARICTSIFYPLSFRRFSAPSIHPFDRLFFDQFALYSELRVLSIFSRKRREDDMYRVLSFPGILEKPSSSSSSRASSEAFLKNLSLGIPLLVKTNKSRLDGIFILRMMT